MDYNNYEITEAYTLQNFFDTNNKHIRNIFKYVTDDYGVPTLKQFVLFGKKLVGLGPSVENTPINYIFENPEKYQILELEYKNKSKFYRLCEYKMVHE